MKKFFVFLALGLLIFYLWARTVDWPELQELVLRARLGDAALAFGFLFLGFSFRIYRLFLLFRRFQPLSFLLLFRVFMATAFLNYFLTWNLGTPVELYLFKKFGNVSFPRSLSAIITSRIYEAMLLFGLLCFSVLSGLRISSTIAPYVWLIGGGLLFVLFMFYFVAEWEKRVTFIWRKIFFFLPESARGSVSDFISNFFQEMRAMKGDRALVLQTVLTSFAILAFEGSFMLFSARAFSIHMPALHAFLAIGLFSFSVILPHPPGQVGLAEVYLLTIFSTILSYPNTPSAGAALLAHFIATCIMGGVGGACLASLGIKMAEIIPLRPRPQ